MKSFLSFYPLIYTVLAHSQDAFYLPERDQIPISSTLPAHRVAIIGAGAAGSSVAYHLAQYAAESPNLLNITIFDPKEHAGGRSTTVNALDDPDYPTELGASIFVKINHILYNAAEEFGLQTSSANNLRPKESDYSLGVWDGRQFVYKAASNGGRWSGYWDVMKLLWKYGMAPIRTQRLAKETVGKFLKMYEKPVFPFKSLTETAASLELLDYTSTNGEAVLEAGGVGGAFARDVVQASTRVNYAQNLGQIHGLEALVCMAIEGAVAVEGGNWQIFDEMVKRSGVSARFDTFVTDIDAHDNGTYSVKSKSSKTPKLGTDPHFDTAESLEDEVDEEIFDTVIVATPIHFSNITLSPPLNNPPNPIPYVTLHVTLLTSPHRLSQVYFGQAKQMDVPEMVITTLPEGMDMGNARGIDAVGPAGFWSISTLRSIRRDGERVQYLYKIFSPAPVTGTWLSNVLDFEYESKTESDSLSDIPKNYVTWAHEKVWHSYPYEIPRTMFEKLDFSWGESGRLLYTSGIEGFISTMETSALMGKNIARLVADEMDTQLLLNWATGSRAPDRG